MGNFEVSPVATSTSFGYGAPCQIQLSVQCPWRQLNLLPPPKGVLPVLVQDLCRGSAIPDLLNCLSLGHSIHFLQLKGRTLTGHCCCAWAHGRHLFQPPQCRDETVRLPAPYQAASEKALLPLVGDGANL